MPRRRDLKPEFFTDAELLELSPLHRLLFAGLWCWADREGRLRDKPRDLKLQILPGDGCDVDAMLEDLAGAGFIERYEVNGEKFLWIPKLKEHQRIHPDEAKSRLPEPPLNPIGSNETPLDSVKSERIMPSSLISDLCKKDMSAEPPPTAGSAEVFAHWRATFGKNGTARFSPKRQKAVKARLKEGRTVEELKRAIDGCRLSPFHRGENERHQVYDELELICRDNEHVERFMALATGPPGATHFTEFKPDEEDNALPPQDAERS